MTIQSKKQEKAKNGFIIRSVKSGTFGMKEDIFKKIVPDSGLSSFDRKDTMSFSRYVKENYKDGHKISHIISEKKH